MITRERPILFSGEMVRAMLAGHKTQTRRALKTQPLDVVPFEGDEAGRKWVSLMQRDPNHGGVFKCRYGVPGGQLWVRETWRQTESHIEYRADMNNDGPADGSADLESIRWRPSIYMPRALSRITLMITDLRVERVQDISDYDCHCEGVTLTTNDGENYRDDYKSLWDSINAKRGYGWDANPWVWVISFEIPPA